MTAPDAATADLDLAPLLAAALEPCLWYPEDLVWANSWIAHIPFGFWLVTALRPRVLVDLGVRTGSSYAAFCQAVRQKSLPTRCYGIDSGSGDPRAEFHDGRTYDEVVAWNEARYATFSRLIRATLDEAIEPFSPGTVDLLHIDGRLGDQTVRLTFETWRPRLSAQAVVLFHGTSPRAPDLGARRLWQELSARHPSFEFLHGQGLGVLGAGGDPPPPARALFAAAHDPARRSRTRDFFSRLGEPLMRHAEQLAGAIRELEAERDLTAAAQRSARAAASDAERAHADQARAEARLAAILGSPTWRATATMRGLLDRRPGLRRVLRSAAMLAGRPAASPSPAGSTGDAIGRQRLDRRPRVGRRSDDSIVQATGPIALRVRSLRPETVEQAPPGSSNRPSILCLSRIAPRLARSGAAYRIHRMLAWLHGKGWDVVLLFCPPPGEEPGEAQLTRLAAHYRNLVVVSRDGTLRHGLARADAAAALAALDGRRTRDVATLLGEATGHRDSRLTGATRTACPDALVEALLVLDDALSPRAVLAGDAFMTRGLPLLRSGALKMVDTHGLSAAPSAGDTAFGVADGLALSDAEAATLLARADLVLALEPAAVERLRRVAPAAAMAMVGIDMPVAAPGPLAAAPPAALLVASDTPDNAKGLRDFLRFAWPRVRRALPSAELHVVGTVGDAACTEEAGVRRLGSLDDLTAAYASARVVIDPAVTGPGPRVETFAALAQLRPIVVWPAGVVGLPDELRALCACVTDWFAFAEAVIGLLGDDSARQAILAASERIAQRLSPAIAYAELDRALGDPASLGQASR